ncbi:MAG: FAD-linked oxidase C-terminal domain-containing protein, partial [Candidatus Methylomirabilales bacterium]
VEVLVDPIIEVLQESRVREVRVAKDENERLLLWKGRKSAAAAIGQISPEYLLQDAVVPRTKLPQIMKFIEALSPQYGLRIANLFHAGDGNLHPLILYDSRNKGELDKAEEMAAEIIKACIEMGGSLSGEHGVGLEKRDFMPLMYTNDDLEAMLKVKKVFDPDGLLNPGKIFPKARSLQPSAFRPRSPSPGFSEEVLVQRVSDLIGREHVVAGQGAEAFAVDGKAPKAVVFPGSVEEISALMRFASAEHLTVIPWGNGTKRAFGGIPERVDLVLALSRLNGVVDYEPKDLTATFQAGIGLKEAQAALAPNNQCIPLDPPSADLATIGGILATNSSGPRRLRYGTSRDLVLAIRVVHADGVVTKGGAKVVKNVAGYDMNKLYIGSLGTLGVIVEATFRLYPMPTVEKTYLAPFASIDLAQGVAARILDAPLVPSAVELLNPEASRRVAEQIGLPWPKGNYGLAVVFGSISSKAVEAQLEAVKRFCFEISHAKWETSKGHVLDGQVHETFWRALRDFTLADSGIQISPISNPHSPTLNEVVLKASVLLVKVAEAVRLGEEVAGKHGLGLGVTSSAGSGIIRYYLPGDTASPERFQPGVAEAVNRLRSFAQEAEGSLVVLKAPPEVKNRVEVWGEVGKSLALMEGLKEQFDPKRILNPGRFVGGI